MNVHFPPALLWPIPLLLAGLALLLHFRSRVDARRRATGDSDGLLKLHLEQELGCDFQPGTVGPLTRETRRPGRALIRAGGAVVAAAVLLVILATLGAASIGGDVGFALVWTLYGAYLVALVGVVLMVLGLIQWRILTSTTGTLASRLAVWSLALLSVFFSLCLLRFSVPPIRGTITVMRAGGKSAAGASIKRIVFGKPLFGALLGVGNDGPIAGADVTVLADSRGEFRIPGWVALWPKGFVGVTGVGIVALSQGNATAVTCLTKGTGRYRQYLGDSCTSLGHTSEAWLREDHRWRLGQIDLALHVGRAAVPAAGEEHIQLLASLTTSDLIGPNEFCAELERHLRLYELTEGGASAAESVASQWDSPSHPGPYPLEAVRILRLVAPYRNSALEMDRLARSGGLGGFDERLAKATGAAGSAGSPRTRDEGVRSRPPKELEELLRKLGNPPYTPQWRTLCALQPGKVDGNLLAFGQAMWMWELLASSECPQATRVELAALANELTGTLAKPGVADPSWIRDVPKVTVGSDAYNWQATSGLLSRLRVPHRLTRNVFDPAAEARAHPLMVIPTGGFQQRQAGDPKWWSAYAGRLRRFVEAGGTLFVFVQAVGGDYAIVPGSGTDPLAVKGYREAPFQEAGTIRCAAPHPLYRLFGPTQRLSMMAKGRFERWPHDATVLLSDAATGLPLAVVYALGKGSVLVTTLAEDTGFFVTGGSDEGRAFVAGGLRWASHQPTTWFTRPAGETRPVEFRARLENASRARATSVEWILLGPPGGPGKVMGAQAINLGPGQAIDLEVSLRAAPELLGGGGLYQILYRLSDTERRLSLGDGRTEAVQLQPPGEAALVAVTKG
jgi:hypothetical protein